MTGAGSRAALATLVSLEGMGPTRLRAMLRRRTPSEALDAVLAGRAPLAPPPDVPPPRISRSLLAKWQAAARRLDPDAILAGYHRAGFEVVMFGEEEYPARLLADPDPPLLLSIAGDLGRLARRTVAIVGTRRCTRAGYDLAFALGRDLAAAGVTVVSGLAKGIDAAAHRGAAEAASAAPLAVAGTGLDVPYPIENAQLWRDVAAAGAVISESPLGARPDRWRFPARNRIIAAMAEVVVVVESPAKGGSMHTVEEADLRSIEVLAVPGPVRSRSSEGTNALLYEGRGVARNVDDVLAALGTFVAHADRRAAVESAGRTPESRLLEAFEWQAATVDQLVVRSGLDVFEVCGRLEAMVADGNVIGRHGWYERIIPDR